MILPKGGVLTILTFPKKPLSAGLRASAPSGRAACVHNNPGLRASAPSGRANYSNFPPNPLALD